MKTNVNGLIFDKVTSDEKQKEDKIIDLEPRLSLYVRSLFLYW